MTDLATERIHVRRLPLDALSPHPNNARFHSERQIARLADAIATFGFNVPVLVDEKGTILAGHARVLAAKRLGLSEVPAIALGHLDEARRRAFMIADNRLAELASWDEPKLALELRGLENLALDFVLSATGFEPGEIDLRVGAVAAADAPGARPGRRGGALSERAAKPRRPVARAGDEWRLGPHRLVCGDDGDAEAYRAIDAAIGRWQALSGEDARLEDAGETFAAIARVRRRRRGKRASGSRPTPGSGPGGAGNEQRRGRR